MSWARLGISVCREASIVLTITSENVRFCYSVTHYFMFRPGPGPGPVKGTEINANGKYVNSKGTYSRIGYFQ
jgi:hypothetical protein